MNLPRVFVSLCRECDDPLYQAMPWTGYVDNWHGRRPWRGAGPNNHMDRQQWSKTARKSCSYRRPEVVDIIDSLDETELLGDHYYNGNGMNGNRFNSRPYRGRGRGRGQARGRVNYFGTSFGRDHHNTYSEYERENDYSPRGKDFTRHDRENDYSPRDRNCDKYDRENDYSPRDKNFNKYDRGNDYSPRDKKFNKFDRENGYSPRNKDLRDKLSNNKTRRNLSSPEREKQWSRNHEYASHENSNWKQNVSYAHRKSRRSRSPGHRSRSKTPEKRRRVHHSHGDEDKYDVASDKKYPRRANSPYSSESQIRSKCYEQDKNIYDASPRYSQTRQRSSRNERNYNDKDSRNDVRRYRSSSGDRSRSPCRRRRHSSSQKTRRSRSLSRENKKQSIRSSRSRGSSSSSSSRSSSSRSTSTSSSETSEQSRRSKHVSTSPEKMSRKRTYEYDSNEKNSNISSVKKSIKTEKKYQGKKYETDDSEMENRTPPRLRKKTMVTPSRQKQRRNLCNKPSKNPFKWINPSFKRKNITCFERSESVIEKTLYENISVESLDSSDASREPDETDHVSVEQKLKRYSENNSNECMKQKENKNCTRVIETNCVTIEQEMSQITCSKDESESERTVEVKGKEINECDRTVELKGQDVKEYDRTVELKGQEINESDRTVELKGQEINESDRTVKLKGQEINESDRTVELKGQEINESDRTVKLKGQEINEVNSSQENIEHVSNEESKVNKDSCNPEGEQHELHVNVLLEKYDKNLPKIEEKSDNDEKTDTLQTATLEKKDLFDPFNKCIKRFMQDHAPGSSVLNTLDQWSAGMSKKYQQKETVSNLTVKKTKVNVQNSDESNTQKSVSDTYESTTISNSHELQCDVKLNNTVSSSVDSLKKVGTTATLDRNNVVHSTLDQWSADMSKKYQQETVSALTVKNIKVNIQNSVDDPNNSKSESEKSASTAITSNTKLLCDGKSKTAFSSPTDSRKIVCNTVTQDENNTKHNTFDQLGAGMPKKNRQNGKKTKANVQKCAVEPDMPTSESRKTASTVNINSFKLKDEGKSSPMDTDKNVDNTVMLETYNTMHRTLDQLGAVMSKKYEHETVSIHTVKKTIATVPNSEDEPNTKTFKSSNIAPTVVTNSFKSQCDGRYNTALLSPKDIQKKVGNTATQDKDNDVVRLKDRTSSETVAVKRNRSASAEQVIRRDKDKLSKNIWDNNQFIPLGSKHTPKKCSRKASIQNDRFMKCTSSENDSRMPLIESSSEQNNTEYSKTKHFSKANDEDQDQNNEKDENKSDNSENSELTSKQSVTEKEILFKKNKPRVSSVTSKSETLARKEDLMKKFRQDHSPLKKKSLKTSSFAKKISHLPYSKNSPKRFHAKKTDSKVTDKRETHGDHRGKQGIGSKKPIDFQNPDNEKVEKNSKEQELPDFDSEIVRDGNKTNDPKYHVKVDRNKEKDSLSFNEITTEERLDSQKTELCVKEKSSIKDKLKATHTNLPAILPLHHSRKQRSYSGPAETQTNEKSATTRREFKMENCDKNIFERFSEGMKSFQHKEKETLCELITDQGIVKKTCVTKADEGKEKEVCIPIPSHKSKETTCALVPEQDNETINIHLSKQGIEKAVIHVPISDQEKEKETFYLQVPVQGKIKETVHDHDSECGKEKSYLEKYLVQCNLQNSDAIPTEETNILEIHVEEDEEELDEDDIELIEISNSPTDSPVTQSDCSDEKSHEMTIQIVQDGIIKNKVEISNNEFENPVSPALIPITPASPTLRQAHHIASVHKLFKERLPEETTVNESDPFESPFSPALMPMTPAPATLRQLAPHIPSVHSMFRPSEDASNADIEVESQPDINNDIEITNSPLTEQEAKSQSEIYSDVEIMNSPLKEQIEKYINGTNLNKENKNKNDLHLSGHTRFIDDEIFYKTEDKENVEKKKDRLFSPNRRRSPHKRFGSRLENASRQLDDDDEDNTTKMTQNNDASTNQSVTNANSLSWLQKAKKSIKTKQKPKASSVLATITQIGNDKDTALIATQNDLVEKSNKPKETSPRKVIHSEKCAGQENIENESDSHNSIISPTKELQGTATYSSGFEVCHTKVLHSDKTVETIALLKPKNLYYSSGRCLLCQTCSTYFTPLAYTVHHDDKLVLNEMDLEKSKQGEFSFLQEEMQLWNWSAETIFDDFVKFFNAEKSKNGAALKLKPPAKPNVLSIEEWQQREKETTSKDQSECSMETEQDEPAVTPPEVEHSVSTEAAVAPSTEATVAPSTEATVIPSTEATVTPSRVTATTEVTVAPPEGSVASTEGTVTPTETTAATEATVAPSETTAAIEATVAPSETTATTETIVASTEATALPINAKDLQRSQSMKSTADLSGLQELECQEQSELSQIPCKRKTRGKRHHSWQGQNPLPMYQNSGYFQQAMGPQFHSTNINMTNQPYGYHQQPMNRSVNNHPEYQRMRNNGNMQQGFPQTMRPSDFQSTPLPGNFTQNISSALHQVPPHLQQPHTSTGYIGAGLPAPPEQMISQSMNCQPQQMSVPQPFTYSASQSVPCTVALPAVASGLPPMTAQSVQTPRQSAREEPSSGSYMGNQPMYNALTSPLMENMPAEPAFHQQNLPSQHRLRYQSGTGQSNMQATNSVDHLVQEQTVYDRISPPPQTNTLPVHQSNPVGYTPPNQRSTDDCKAMGNLYFVNGSQHSPVVTSGITQQPPVTSRSNGQDVDRTFNKLLMQMATMCNIQCPDDGMSMVLLSQLIMRRGWALMSPDLKNRLTSMRK